VVTLAAAMACLLLAALVAPGPVGRGRMGLLRGGPAGTARSYACPVAVPAAAGALAGLVVLGPAGGLAGAAAGTAWHRSRLGRRAVRAEDAATAELADALGRITEELRAGAHPAAALAGVRSDGPQVREALGPAARAAALGDGIPAVLAAEAGRRPEVSRSLSRVARAWALAERHGVPLADLLAGVRTDLSWRSAHSGRVRAQLAGPRATAAVLAALPALGLGLGELVGAGPLAVLRSSALGQLLVVLGLGLVAVGSAWTARILRSAVSP
jgi:tight adherence protein B